MRQRVIVEQTDTTVVEGLNFELKPQDLMVVVGQVGCGKTTLLYSLMEETKLKSGSR